MLEVTMLFLLMLVPAVTLLFQLESSASPPQPERTRDFIKQNCVSCHDGAEAEGGLDLTTLSEDLADAATETRWVRIFDRVN